MFQYFLCIIISLFQFMECCRIGRDLLRLLQNVARIPEFELLWKDILHKPQAINPQFGGRSWYKAKTS